MNRRDELGIHDEPDEISGRRDSDYYSETIGYRDEYGSAGPELSSPGREDFSSAELSGQGTNSSGIKHARSFLVAKARYLLAAVAAALTVSVVVNIPEDIALRPGFQNGVHGGYMDYEGSDEGDEGTPGNHQGNGNAGTSGSDEGTPGRDEGTLGSDDTPGNGAGTPGNEITPESGDGTPDSNEGTTESGEDITTADEEFECPFCHGTKIYCPGGLTFGYDRGNAHGYAGCGGTGYSKCPDMYCHDGVLTCAECNGTGMVGVVTCGICGGKGIMDDCEFCHGTGIAVCISLADHEECPFCHEDSCHTCFGSGFVCAGYEVNYLGGTVYFDGCNGTDIGLCMDCGGAGMSDCAVCGGTRYVVCDVCEGHGDASCSGCGGRLRRFCGNCKGRGHFKCKSCSDGRAYPCPGEHSICPDCKGTGRK